MAADTAPSTQFFGDGKRLLLVASTGGHLTQLVKFAERENVSDDSLWVSFDTPQSRDMLKGRRTLWVDYVAPRDLIATFRAYRKLRRQLDASEFDGVLSTGAAVGFAGLLWGKRNGVPGVYVESVSRTDGPSITGRAVRSLNLARTFTQHHSWAGGHWKFTEPVQGTNHFDHLEKVACSKPARPDAPLKILVTLGTIRPYRFDSLVNRVTAIMRPGDTVTWQLGATERHDLPGECHEALPTADLMRAAKAADVVITHAGVGSIVQLLELGISPVVVPRHRKRGEHVDDHQLQIWRRLGEKGLAHPVEVADLNHCVLVEAASHRTVALAES